MSIDKVSAVADVLKILGQIIALIGQAIAGGQQSSVKKILGAELQTTLIKTRADLEAIVRFRQ